jgi:hypothetical protein
MRVRMRHALGVLVPFVAGLAGARALHVQRQASVPCREFVWESSPTVLYNLAFAMSRNSVLQDWVFAFEGANLTQACVNASYTSAFDDPQLLVRIDLGSVAVRKTACFSGGVLSERAAVANVPYFGPAHADVSAARDPARPADLRVTAAFGAETPWVFKVAERALATHVGGYLDRYIALLARAVCA